MTPEMKEYIKLTARLEAASQAVLNRGLKCDTRLELMEALKDLALWLKENKP